MRLLLLKDRASDILHRRGAAKIQVNLQNPAKFKDTLKIPRTLPEVLSNTCQFFTGNNYQWAGFSIFCLVLSTG